MNTSLDLSNVAELAPLAKIVQTIDAVAANVAEGWFIVGATARDLLLRHGHGMAIRRFTVDVDIAVAVRTWKDYTSLQDALIARGATRDRKVHRFHIGEWTLDVLPFGGVAANNRIAWPPEGNPVMSVLGFDEAAHNTIHAHLPGGTSADVVTIPALLILKLIAWEERHFERPRDDARDISLLLSAYAAPWNQDRLYDAAGDLLEAFAFDNDRAAAALLGRDAGKIARSETRDRILSILRRETMDETYKLARDMDGRVENNLKLLEAVLAGFSAPLAVAPGTTAR